MRLCLFATRNDLLGVFGQLEERYEFRYASQDVIVRERPPMVLWFRWVTQRIFGPLNCRALRSVYDTIAEIPRLGLARSSRHVQTECFMICRAGTELKCNLYRLKSGGLAHGVSNQYVNRRTVLFWPGGLTETGDVVVMGEIASVSDHRESAELYDLLRSAIAGAFLKSDRAFIGREAYQLLEKGVRFIRDSEAKTDPDWSKLTLI